MKPSNAFKGNLGLFLQLSRFPPNKHESLLIQFICALKSVYFRYSVGPVQLVLLFLVPVLADICILDH